MTQTGCSDKATRQASLDTPAQIDHLMDVDETDRRSKPDPLQLFEQTAPSGLSVSWLAYGATLHSVRLPDGMHILARLNETEDYRGPHPYIGPMIGRVANRISDASFTIDGTDYIVAANEAGHALHGGPGGFDRVVWDVVREGDELVFRHTSPDGHQGYPGNLDVTLRTRLSGTELRLQHIAITDAPTPVSLTHHGYWNPASLFGQSVDRLRLISPADRYTVTDEALIPTGEVGSVEGTSFDFRQMRAIGPAVIDVNLLVPGTGLREMARLTDGTRTITLLSDYPGLQVFTGDTLGDVGGMEARAGLALEPQYPPDSVNHPVDSEDTILRPGEVYRHTIIYRFDGPGFESGAQ